MLSTFGHLATLPSQAPEFPKLTGFAEIRENSRDPVVQAIEKKWDDNIEKYGAKSHRLMMPRDITPFRDLDPKAPPYIFVRRLGAGANGSVDAVAATQVDCNENIIPEGDKRNKATYALKTFISPKGGTEGAKKAQKHEYDIMKRLEALSPIEKYHMVKLHDVFSVNDGTASAQYYLVMMPIADSGNLVLYLLKQKPGNDALCAFMGCLVTGLGILLKAKIRHHDIHPWNILVHEDRPLYTDFGLSYDFENSKQSRTLEDARHQSQFAAPEYHNGQFRGSKAEVFALGAVLYEIMAVYLDNADMLEKRATMSNTQFGLKEESADARLALQEANLKTPEPLSKLWLEIIVLMLEIDPEARCDIDTILDKVERGGSTVCTHCMLWRKGVPGRDPNFDPEQTPYRTTRTNYREWPDFLSGGRSGRENAAQSMAEAKAAAEASFSSSYLCQDDNSDPFIIQ